MRIAAAIVLLVASAVLGLAEALTILDPVGTKMADDGDPFGRSTTPWAHHAGLAAAILACVAGAGLLLRRTKVR
jgi:hypothetical protein